jgi:uroporphyrinogen-III synthase
VPDITRPGPDLSGLTVGVTADRRANDQVVMFSRIGARVVLGPTIATVRIPDPDLLRARTGQLCDDPPDFVIANTGVGMRTWMAAATDWGLEERLRSALSRSRILARGPKAAGALVSTGLEVWWRSPSEQLAEVIERLVDVGLEGRRVAFQLHGDDSPEVVSRLRAAGADVITVPVYVWHLPPDPGPALGLIEGICERDIDAVTFTAGPQVRSMLQLAAGVGRKTDLLDALNGDVVVGCIGPVCAGVATDAGISSPVVPANWRLGSLVKVVAETLDSRRDRPT